MYALAKLLHVGCAIVSASFFLIRGLWMLQGSSKLQQLWVRIVPHAIDTVLLLSGVYLAMLWHWADWILVKLVAVVVYIVLGLFALRPNFSGTVKRASFVGALVSVAFVFMIAMVGRSF